MKAGKGQFPAALDRPEPSIRFYLFHGPDEAGSRALALRLLRGLGNAEKFIVLGNAIKTDPATLADEAGAMALFGGPRAIWIEPAGDEISEGVEALLDSPASESAVVAVAGQLRKTSSLLKLAEAHSAALSHCSYVPEGRDMERVVVELGKAHGLRMLPDVAQRVAAAANNNQAIAQQELIKFALFLCASGDRQVELDHATIDLLGADAAETDLNRLGDLAQAARMPDLVGELARMPGGGNQAIPILGAVQRRMLLPAPLQASIQMACRTGAGRCPGPERSLPQMRTAARARANR